MSLISDIEKDIDSNLSVTFNSFSSYESAVDTKLLLEQIINKDANTLLNINNILFNVDSEIKNIFDNNV